MSVDRRVSVGFYADESRATKVHIHVTGRGPVCGVQVRRGYQWCSWNNLAYVECDRCLRSPLAAAMQKRDRALIEANIILDR